MENQNQNNNLPLPPIQTSAPEVKKTHLKMILLIVAGVLIMGVSALAIYLNLGSNLEGRLKTSAPETCQTNYYSILKDFRCQEIKPGNCDLVKTIYQNQTEYILNNQTKQNLQTWYNRCTEKTEISTSTCLEGETFDARNKSCVCDQEGEYFEVTLQDSIKQQIPESDSRTCMSCTQISAQLKALKTDQTLTPTEVITQKNSLEAVAAANNCNLCSELDDAIHSTYKNEQWLNYYQSVVLKLEDRTCGINLNICDNTKWKLIFALSLKEQIGTKDQATSVYLDKEIKTLRQALLYNSCVDTETVCRELETPEQSVIGRTAQGSVSAVRSLEKNGQRKAPVGGLGSEALRINDEIGEPNLTNTQPTGEVEASTEEKENEGDVSIDLNAISDAEYFRGDTEFIEQTCGKDFVPPEEPKEMEEPVKEPLDVTRVIEEPKKTDITSEANRTDDVEESRSTEKPEEGGNFVSAPPGENGQDSNNFPDFGSTDNGLNNGIIAPLTSAPESEEDDDDDELTYSSQPLTADQNDQPNNDLDTFSGSSIIAAINDNGGEVENPSTKIVASLQQNGEFDISAPYNDSTLESEMTGSTAQNTMENDTVLHGIADSYQKTPYSQEKQILSETGPEMYYYLIALIAALVLGKRKYALK